MLPGLSTGGGAFQPSSTATAGMDARNDISSGTITVGGLNMGPPPSLINSDMVLQGGAVVLIGLAALWAYKKMT